MPNTISAKKRLKTADKAAILNRSVRSEIRTSLKKLRSAVKKEELLGTSKVVEVPQEGETAQPSEATEIQTETENQEETNGSEPVTQEN